MNIDYERSLFMLDEMSIDGIMTVNRKNLCTT